jgi:hypothetical protein
VIQLDTLFIVSNEFKIVTKIMCKSRDKEKERKTSGWGWLNKIWWRFCKFSHNNKRILLYSSSSVVSFSWSISDITRYRYNGLQILISKIIRKKILNYGYSRSLINRDITFSDSFRVRHISHSIFIFRHFSIRPNYGTPNLCTWIEDDSFEQYFRSVFVELKTLCVHLSNKKNWSIKSNQ